MSGRTEGGTSSTGYFQKPSLDDMGPGTDTERPLFRKPDLDEMGRKSEGQSLFRKNTLNEMTVGRTEKPITGHVPEKPILTRAKPGIGSYEDQADEKRQKGRTKGKTGRPGR
jgi:excinuclease ABC subunit B